MSITLIIVIVTCIVSFMCFTNEESRMKLIFHPYTIKRFPNQWIRFISGGFIHSDYLHLGFNMLALYSFGSFIEGSLFPMLFGNYYKIGYVLFYLTAIAFSDIYTFFKHKDNSNYYSLGASGAVSAIVYATILFAPKIIIMGMPGWLYGFLYLGFSSYASKKNLGNIAHDAHIWGAIYGLAVPLIFKPELLFNLINQIF